MKHTISYLDDNNNFVSKEEATHAMIQNFDDNGNFLGEVFEVLNPNPEDIKTPEDYMSDEQIREVMKKL
ncbi:MAG: hypothetical protein J6X02_02655 [Bacilli bacterium]|nr:hypothetical protein [Bacilli bacterium]